MRKILTLTVLALLLSLAHSSFATIIGPPGSCVGASTMLTDSAGTPGGVWSSSNPVVASVGSSSGIVMGNSPGVATISYVVGTITETFLFTVTAAPAPIGGIFHQCVGGATTLTDATSGGTWTSSNPFVATIGSATGVTTGVHAGTTTINYIVGPGCSAIASDTVIGGTPDSVIGLSTVCVGSTTALSGTPSGGTWSSTPTTIATISTGGVVTGVSAGVATITYTISSGSCGSASVTHTMTVTSTPSAGTISGTMTVAIGGSTTLSETVGGGTWSSGGTGIATISSGGVATGVTAGTATISYAVAGCGSVSYATAVMTVTPFGGISGNVLFTGASYTGSVKVWLIHKIGFMLTAVDSTVVTSSGTSAYYQFTTAPTDSYRVKAAVIDTTGATTGYIPTYHTSSFYWYTATVFHHTIGTADINKDITMAYGTVTSGPGFIAGDVTTGANKGTSGIPAVGLKMYAVNTTTGAIVQQTLTDAAGHYYFTNLPIGQTYTIFPEAMSYITTVFPPITLTTANPTMTAASFIQHTISLTITPIVVSVHNVSASTSTINVFPNPTSGKLNVEWNVAGAEHGNVIISDITGHEVYNASIDMAAGAGAAQLDLSGLSNGLYMISVKTSSLNYNNKIQIQK